MGLLFGPGLSWRQMLFSAVRCRGGRGQGEKSEGAGKMGAVVWAKRAGTPALGRSEGVLEAGYQGARICSFYLANHQQEISGRS